MQADFHDLEVLGIAPNCKSLRYLIRVQTLGGEAPLDSVKAIMGHRV